MGKKADQLWVPDVQVSPWLVYTHGTSKHKQIQTFCSISELSPNKPIGRSYIKSIPALRSKSICGFCHGWLILRDTRNTKMFSLWNPFTSQSLFLPCLPIDPDTVNGHGNESFTLIKSEVEDTRINKNNNINNSYKVRLVLLFFKNLVFSCRLSSTISGLNSSSWVTHRLELDGKRVNMEEIITVNEIIYGWASTGGPPLVLSMEFANDDSNSLTIKPLQIRAPRNDICCFHYKEYWVESRGRIYLISVYIRHGEDDRISRVQVLELDLVGMNWVEVKSLDGRAFFVGKYCSTWCLGGSGSIHENCVYFTNPFWNDDTVFSYSLDDGCLTMFLSCPKLQSPFSCPIWLNMMPQHHRKSGVQDSKGQESCPQNHENEYDEVRDHGMISTSINYKGMVQDKEIKGECRVTQLPDHLINLFPKYMHLFDFWNFRDSCKTFKAAIPPELQRRTNNVVPLFLSMIDGGLCEIIDLCRDDSCIKCFQLSSEPFAIDFSKDGWLVISVGHHKLLKYFNLFTKVKGDFPVRSDLCFYTSVGFSTYPTSPDCLTIAIAEKVEVVEINVAREETWVSYQFPLVVDGYFEFHAGRSIPIYFAGTFYVLDKKGYLGAFTLVDNEASWRVYGRPHGTWDIDTTFHSTHLVECGGELHAVFIGCEGKSIEVFKFDLLQKKWFEVTSIGNHILFFSHTSSFSVETMKVGMRNRIYLSRLKGNGIVFYSLDTCKYHVSGSDESMENFYGTKEPMQCCWL